MLKTMLSKRSAIIEERVLIAFSLHNSSGRTMALGLTQPLKEMSTRNKSWGVKTTGA
jgi:hypothetical protein